MVTDLISRITNAIIRQEGMPPTYPNPGNLRGGPWLPHPVIAHGFWVPDTRAMGVAGAAHLVALRVAEGWTLAQLISSWAPAGDGGNNPTVYIAHVKQWAGVPDENVKLWEYLGT